MKKRINKSLVTNLLAVLVIVTGYFCPLRPELMKSIGFFALSGALTNWLAVYMLFEKIPLLYGSGVIPNRFDEFRVSIKALMMEQFFSPQNVEQFIQKEEREGSRFLNLEPLLNAVDYDRLYDSLVRSIMESTFGSMLQMMGGEQALLPLKEPFVTRMRSSLESMAHSERFENALRQGLDAHKISEDIIEKIERVIDNRLNQLTPQMVKEIVQGIIREHLGWLVVWGGVLGGSMGALFSIA